MSLISIYNAALVPLGADRVLDPLEESDQAIKCNEIFPDIRDDELSSHPWNFALERAQLARTTDTPLYDYTYEYQIPSDSLRVIEIETDEDAFEREGDRILTDVSTLYVQYIKQITDTNAFSPSFRAVLSARLQFELAGSLTSHGTTYITMLYEIYQRKVKRAKAIDAQEGTPQALFADRAVNARLGRPR